MRDFKKRSHALWECKYHLVWCPKCRFWGLKAEVGKSVRDILEQLWEWKEVEIFAGNIRIDHVHVVVSISPKYAVSDLVGFVEGKSAIKIFDMNPSLKGRYWGRHFGAKGYCVSAVGLDEEQIKKYVRWQLKGPMCYTA